MVKIIVLVLSAIVFAKTPMFKKGSSKPAEYNYSEQEKVILNEIKKSNFCETAKDCEVIQGVCPFGCNIVLNKDSVEKIQKLIRGLDGKHSCVYSCEPVQYSVACVKKKCESKAREPSNLIDVLKKDN